MYSQPGARVRNITNNPKVTLNFAGDGRGGDIVIFAGAAEIIPSAPNAAENPAWVAKYTEDWKLSGMTARSFAERFSIPLTIRIRDTHGH